MNHKYYGNTKYFYTIYNLNGKIYEILGLTKESHDEALKAFIHNVKNNLL